MTDIPYMINKHSKIIFIYICYENEPRYYVSNVFNFDDLNTIFGLSIMMIDHDNSKIYELYNNYGI